MAMLVDGSENVHTGVNFIEKAESSATVRFVRITYVRRASDQGSSAAQGESGAVSSSSQLDVVGPPAATFNATSAAAAARYQPPAGLSYRTFVPAAVKVGMCSGAPEYESFTATWERSKAWLKCIGLVLSYIYAVFLKKNWHILQGRVVQSRGPSGF